MLEQVLPPTLAASLLAEKNAELDEQGHMLTDLRTKVAEVSQFLASGSIKEATQLVRISVVMFIEENCSKNLFLLSFIVYSTSDMKQNVELLNGIMPLPKRAD